MIKLDELNALDKVELFNNLRLEITHHSNHMEGNSLEYGETKALLENATTASNKPLSDHLIIIGFANAYDEVLRSYSKPLTSNYIKDLHAIIFSEALRVCPDRVSRPVGAYRSEQRYIQGVDIDLSHPHKISNDLENLLFQEEPSNITQIALFHQQFELIHPFSDGNGRVGRLIIHKQFMQNNLIPPLIKSEYREEYIDSMEDTQKLAKFLEFSQTLSLKIIQNNNQHDDYSSKIRKQR